jgi:hypothetical protein
MPSARTKQGGSTIASRNIVITSIVKDAHLTPEQPAIVTPARRNSSAARGKWVRSLTNMIVRHPWARSNTAVSRAFPSVSRDPHSTSSAAAGTPSANAARRMISASGSSPRPPPDSTTIGAHPWRNNSTARLTRRRNRDGDGHPSTTMASALAEPGIGAEPG